MNSNNNKINNSKIEKDLDNALLKRALGYEYEEKVIEVTKDGKPINIKVLKKHVPPDIKAIEQVRMQIACGLIPKEK